jgi:TPR repeat protein
MNDNLLKKSKKQQQMTSDETLNNIQQSILSMDYSAAELGSREAWLNLAEMYQRGDGVAQSTPMARHIMTTIFATELPADIDI